MNSSLLLTELEQIAKHMADAIRKELPSLTRVSYGRFLDAMYHYTLQSGLRLEHSAKHCSWQPAKELFAQLAKEETHHYRLAELDLKGLGQSRTVDTPPLVTQFHDFWMSIPQNMKHPEAAFLGAMYPLENVGQYLTEDAAQVLKTLGLTKDQSRFVIVHLEADVGHGSALSELCGKLPTESATDAQNAAKIAAQFWIDLHLNAFASS